MIDRTTKLRVRRKFRRGRRQIEDIGFQTEEHFDRHFFRRISRLYGVRRFVLSWVLLLVLLSGVVVVQTRALSGYYQELQPVPGGVLTEAAFGTFTNASPLYASNDIDAGVSRLLFSSLLTYTQNNQLTGDLAERWSFDATGKQFTVRLRDNLKWHDGEPLTSDDVLFTYRTIQDTDAKSPLQAGFRGINITTPNDRTIVFKLPSTLASFPYSLTNGIVPKHVLGTVPVENLRSVSFNTSEPIGSGPFRLNGIELRGETPDEREQRISLTPNRFFYREPPKLNQFFIHTFRSQDRMLDAYRSRQVDVIAGLTDVPKDIADDSDTTLYNLPQTSSVMIFLNNSNPILKDPLVRRALVQATDTKGLIKTLKYPSLAADSPLLRRQLGYDRNLVQLPFDISAANSLLKKAGWTVGEDGVRTKGKERLSLRLFTVRNEEYEQVLRFIKNQWKNIGVELETNPLDDSDLSSVVQEHAYDALLYGISIGIDPDVFAYWHSSQANPNAPGWPNFSEYKAEAADRALEAGRTRLDPQLRKVKLKPFLQAWKNDAPAIALYQSRYLYVVRGKIYNFNIHALNTAADRFINVTNWMIRTEYTNK